MVGNGVGKGVGFAGLGTGAGVGLGTGAGVGLATGDGVGLGTGEGVGLATGDGVGLRTGGSSSQTFSPPKFVQSVSQQWSPPQL